jgi:adenosine/AMP kinase
MDVTVKSVKLDFPEGCNIIVGQAHFIKTVEDLSEILVGTVPGITYGLAFSEASPPCLIRTEGNSEELVRDAVACAELVAAGHSFYIIIKNAYPINVLNQIKNCPEVTRVFAATANPLEIVVASTSQGNGIIGVVDGFSPRGVEKESDKAERKAILRRFGYKF